MINVFPIYLIILSFQYNSAKLLILDEINEINHSKFDFFHFFFEYPLGSMFFFVIFAQTLFTTIVNLLIWQAGKS